jgi:hypothetical protein
MAPILYQFSREEIEACDFSRFIKTWPLHQLPRDVSLKECLNQFGFCVCGYESDPRELIETPEVREFFRQFNRVWPFWFFACDLGRRDLYIMTICCLPKLSVIRRRSAVVFQVDYDPNDLRKFVLDGFRGMNFLYARAGMGSSEISERSLRIIEYFGAHTGALE